VGADPGVAGHAAHGVEAGGIDAKIFDKIFADVEANDFSKDDDAAAGSVAGVDDLEQAALHLRGRLGDAGRPNDFAGERCKAREVKFIDFRRHLGGCGVCLRGDGFADDVDDELVCVASTLCKVSLRCAPGPGPAARRAGQKSTVGGADPTPEKKLKGARLAAPLESMVETSATGRGTMMPVISL
jgi:hypothetical protein